MHVTINTVTCMKACCGFTAKTGHPSWVCLRNTGLKQGISCKCSCASVLEPGVPREAILVQKEQGLEEVKRDGNRKKQGTGGLGLSGQGKEDKKLSRGGGEVTQELQK